MTPRERVQTALRHEQPDFTPCDYFYTPEIHLGLAKHFGLNEPRYLPGALGSSVAAMEDGGIAERLGTDIRYVNPPYIGPPLPSFDDGSSVNLWGIRRRPMSNEYGEYAEAVETPFAAWTTVEEVERLPWPNPDWFDYDAMPAHVLAVSRPGHRRGRDARARFHQRRGVRPRRRASAVGYCNGRSGLSCHCRETASLLSGLYRANFGGGRRGGSTWFSAATISAASGAR